MSTCSPFRSDVMGVNCEGIFITFIMRIESQGEKRAENPKLNKDK